MRASGQAGYSLVELLVVLALMGLIAIAISGGMRFGARVWERTESEVAGAEVAQGGHAFLRNLLSAVYPRTTGSGGEGAAFTGEATRMEFLADAFSSSASAGVSRFTLSVRRSGGEASLVLSQTAERGPADKREDVLLSGAKDITFSYAQSADGAANWTESWQDDQNMPTLIRVRISFPPGRGRWPDLIVRPRIDRAANCIYDPVSFNCRNG